MGPYPIGIFCLKPSGPRFGDERTPQMLLMRCTYFPPSFTPFLDCGRSCGTALSYEFCWASHLEPARDFSKSLAPSLRMHFMPRCGSFRFSFLRTSIPVTIRAPNEGYRKKAKWLKRVLSTHNCSFCLEGRIDESQTKPLGPQYFSRRDSCISRIAHFSGSSAARTAAP